MTDAPNRLMSGLDELPRYESELKFFPSWLEFLNRFKALRALSTFGVQFWFYAQLELLGQTGATQPNMSTMAASKRIVTQQNSALAMRDLQLAVAELIDEQPLFSLNLHQRLVRPR